MIYDPTPDAMRCVAAPHGAARRRQLETYVNVCEIYARKDVNVEQSPKFHISALLRLFFRSPFLT